MATPPPPPPAEAIYAMRAAVEAVTALRAGMDIPGPPDGCTEAAAWQGAAAFAATCCDLLAQATSRAAVDAWLVKIGMDLAADELTARQQEPPDSPV